jgi:hypothetical protein
VAKFIYLGTAVTNKNGIHIEIKNRLNLGNPLYHSVQNLLSSHLLPKNLKIKIYKTIILPVVLYECESWSLVLRENRLRVCENRVLRRIFGAKMEEMVRGWKRQHNEELHILYASPRRMRWMGHAPCMGEMHTKFWSENLKGRDSGRPRHRWEDNIKMDVREIWWEGVDWIHLAQDRDQ